jgi:hypothetical protein
MQLGGMQVIVLVPRVVSTYRLSPEILILVNWNAVPSDFSHIVNRIGAIRHEVMSEAIDNREQTSLMLIRLVIRNLIRCNPCSKNQKALWKIVC